MHRKTQLLSLFHARSKRIIRGMMQTFASAHKPNAQGHGNKHSAINWEEYGRDDVWRRWPNMPMP